MRLFGNRRRIRRRPKQLVSRTTLDNAFNRRTFVVAGAMGGLATLLAGRMAYIAVAQNEQWELESESNRVNLSLIPPRRGWILDRNGAPLASNRADFRVDVIPERMKDPAGTVSQLGAVLGLAPEDLAEVQQRVADASGPGPVEVADGLTYDQFAAVSVRLPDLRGVVPQRGFSRYYPTGPSVGQLLGYVGPANAEEYAKEKDPLLITPGFKIGKDAVEEAFEKRLRGTPGARRVEVTASGRIARELDTREDVQGRSLQLTIDGPLQDYAARRIGLESASVTVIDCKTGEILALVSMPSFDPNTFVAGIGALRWKMLNEDDHLPLLNKVVRGLYPPGSTMKPMATLALQQHGISPSERVGCPGGYRLGRRFFRCDAVHGSVDMQQAIEKSCNTYFWSMAHRVGYDAIAPVAKMLGLGVEFDLPGINQRYGTIPDSAWKMRRYKQEWTASDSLNAAIGQGYVNVSPLQLAVMTSRIASGRNLTPTILTSQKAKDGPALPFSPEQLQVTREGMLYAVNRGGTAVGSKLDLEGIQMAGKTGTAQVVKLVSRGVVGAWKYRDHAHFICFAPFDEPRYAMAVTVEHGIFGARTAAPIAKDVMTFLFDPQRAVDRLHALEKEWGGTAEQRLQAKYIRYAQAAGVAVEPAALPPTDLGDQVEAEARLPKAPAATPSPAPSAAETASGAAGRPSE